jgi:hypothetical protein
MKPTCVNPSKILFLYSHLSAQRGKNTSSGSIQMTQCIRSFSLTITSSRLHDFTHIKGTNDRVFLPLSSSMLFLRRNLSDEKKKVEKNTTGVKEPISDPKKPTATSSTAPSSSSSVAAQTAKAANALGSATLHYTYEFNRLYSDVEKNVMSKINESNRRRFRLIVISILIGAIVMFVVFGTKIRKGITDGTADIAKETLENESLKIQTQELAMAVVQTILNDKEITSHAANFLREASTVSETQAALLQLTLHVLQHPDSLNELQILVKKLLSLLSQDNVAYSSSS